MTAGIAEMTARLERLIDRALVMVVVSVPGEDTAIRVDHRIHRTASLSFANVGNYAENRGTVVISS